MRQEKQVVRPHKQVMLLAPCLLCFLCILWALYFMVAPHDGAPSPRDKKNLATKAQRHKESRGRCGKAGDGACECVNFIRFAKRRGQTGMSFPLKNYREPVRNKFLTVLIKFRDIHGTSQFVNNIAHVNNEHTERHRRK